MHRAGVICQKQPALSQLLNQLLEVGLANEIETTIAQRRDDLCPDLLIFGGAEENPFATYRRRHPGKNMMANIVAILIIPIFF